MVQLVKLEVVKYIGMMQVYGQKEEKLGKASWNTR